MDIINQIDAVIGIIDANGMAAECCGNPVMDNGYVCCGQKYIDRAEWADQAVKQLEAIKAQINLSATVEQPKCFCCSSSLSWPFNQPSDGYKFCNEACEDIYFLSMKTKKK